MCRIPLFTLLLSAAIISPSYGQITEIVRVTDALRGEAELNVGSNVIEGHASAYSTGFWPGHGSVYLSFMLEEESDVTLEYWMRAFNFPDVWPLWSLFVFRPYATNYLWDPTVALVYVEISEVDLVHDQMTMRLPGGTYQFYALVDTGGMGDPNDPYTPNGDGYVTFRFTAVPVPEPSTLALAAIGVSALVAARRRRRTS